MRQVVLLCRWRRAYIEPVDAPTGPSRRDRLRAALVAEIHDQAYRQIAADGFAAVSMTGIAQSLGMSPAALYRYFPSREDLIRALVAESFEANAVLTEQALAETEGLAPGLRLLRVLAVTRQWAVTHPTQYEIIQGVLRNNQIEDADVMVDPERRPFRAILSLVAELQMPGTLAKAMAPVLQEASQRRPGAAAPSGYPAEALLHALVTWSRLSGAISLEINGVLDRMGIDATSFFDAELAQLLPHDDRAATDG
jgi:AcrR family transcriptional regulator